MRHGSLGRWLLVSAFAATAGCAAGSAVAIDGAADHPAEHPRDADLGDAPPEAAVDAAPDSRPDAPPPDAAPDSGRPGRHLLISEVVVTPTTAEFIEIYNPTGQPIDLSDYYLSDRNNYYLLVTGVVPSDLTDFVARFPDGASIGPLEYQTVALHTAADFMGIYGASPTYEMPAGSSATVPDMRPALAGSIGTSMTLTDSGEPIMLFFWDQTSDLVKDVDYLLYGAGSGPNGPIDKTGLAIDGPDPDAMGTAFAADTPAASQVALATHMAGGSLVRCDFSDGDEVPGGNGLGGEDETSEPWSTTWRVNASNPANRTPGAAPAPGFCP